MAHVTNKQPKKQIRMPNPWLRTGTVKAKGRTNEGKDNDWQGQYEQDTNSSRSVLGMDSRMKGAWYSLR